MKLYKGNKPNKLKRTTLRDIMAQSIKIEDYEVSQGSFGDESSSWISLKKIGENEITEISISFNYEGTEIDNIRSWKTPIKKVVVDDEQIRIL